MSLPGGWLENEAKNAGAKFYANIYLANNFNPIRFWRGVKTIQNLIKEFRPDIMACHSTAAGFIGRIAAKNSRPTIYTAHGWSFETGTPWWRRLPAIMAEKYAAKFCQKIICVSKYTRDMGVKHRIADKDKFAVIYNGVEKILTQPQAENSIIKIIFVGRLSKQKDPELLVKAASGLSPDLIKQIEVSIIGSGPKAGLLSNLAGQNKNLRVKMLDNVSRGEAVSLLKNSDIFVLSSNWEGFPYSILEAMGSGLPVIATDVGGISEAVDSSCGFLIKRGDVAGLKEALTKLIIDKNLRRNMGENGRRIAENKFSLQKMLTETENLYKSIV